MTVAVVVEFIVALFGGGHDGSLARTAPLVVGADFYTSFANTDALGAGGTIVARTGLSVLAGFLTVGCVVDLPVAIVVLVVACFSNRRRFALTQAPLSILAGLHTIATGTDISGIGRPRITRPRISLLARSAIFIDLAVAIVVLFVVTNFFGGGFGFSYTGSRPFSLAARLTASATNPYILCSCGAGITGPGLAILTGSLTGRVIIDFAVAIIVELITHFLDGQDLAFTG